MTVDQALEIFWKAYEDCPEARISGVRHLKQSELYKYAIGEVLNAVDKEWAERYLAMSQSSEAVKYQFTKGSLSPKPQRDET